MAHLQGTVHPWGTAPLHGRSSGSTLRKPSGFATELRRGLERVWANALPFRMEFLASLLRKEVMGKAEEASHKSPWNTRK